MSWQRAASELALGEHRTIAPRVSAPAGDSWTRTLRNPPTVNLRPEVFADPLARYEWERIQHRFFKDRRGGIWKNAVNEYVWGPPIPPWAEVVECRAAKDGFKEANERGFYPAVPLCKRVLSIKKPSMYHRWAIAKLADKNPSLIKCIVRHPHFSIDNCWKHSRFYDEEEMGAAYLEFMEAEEKRKAKKKKRRKK